MREGERVAVFTYCSPVVGGGLDGLPARPR